MFHAVQQESLDWGADTHTTHAERLLTGAAAADVGAVCLGWVFEGCMVRLSVSVPCGDAARHVEWFGWAQAAC